MAKAGGGNKTLSIPDAGMDWSSIIQLTARDMVIYIDFVKEAAGMNYNYGHVL
jgi:hypothetical protein